MHTIDFSCKRRKEPRDHLHHHHRRRGRATAVWYRSNGSILIIQSSERPAGGAWSEPLDVSDESHNAFMPQVAADPQGNATAVWRIDDGSIEIIQSSERPAGGVWSEPVDLAQNASFPQVAADPQGNAIAMWDRSSAGDDVLQSSVRPAGGGWSEPVDVSGGGSVSGAPRVAVDNQGNATAVWTIFNGSNFNVQAALFDATGPQLRDIAIPSTGIVGRPVLFSVSRFDLWSPLGETTWSFGDGAAATGEAVSHAFGSAGSYLVRANSTDVFGNATAEAGAIAIAPAPPTRRGTALAARVALVKRGRALLRLRCRGPGHCRGVARLIARVRVRRVVRRNGRRRVVRRTRRVLIGKARFGIAAGRVRVIRVKLNRRGRALLRSARGHRLTVSLAGSGVRHRTVLLKQARSRRPGR
ncbi:MAG TPA: PKD domain-containing protein [Solirubrobacterales bacterium]